MKRFKMKVGGHTWAVKVKLLFKIFGWSLALLKAEREDYGRDEANR